MINDMQHTTAVGTFTGTALTVAVNIGGEDITKTIVLAALGAVVSFIVSITLKQIVKHFRK